MVHGLNQAVFTAKKFKMFPILDFFQFLACLQAMKIVHHHANDRLDWLISGQQGVNPSTEVISTLSGKYKRFTFVQPVLPTLIWAKSILYLESAF